MFNRFNREPVGLVSRGDPNMGFYLILLFLLGSQILSGRSLPSTRQIITVLACFIVAVTIHEFMHAFAAMRLGDDTAVRLGRLTLNPGVHFEPFGFFGMVMISLGYSFIGWGKPVPVNTGRLRGSGQAGRQRAMALIAFAGPLSNVVMAAISAIPIHLMHGTSAQGGDFYYVIWWFFWVNALLASFNAIPIPPLDGYRILVGILPQFWTRILSPLERFGFIILIVLFFIGGRFGSSVTNAMIDPIRSLILRMIPTGAFPL